MTAKKTLLSASLAILCAVSFSAPGFAANSFDGAWSVKIVSDPGCANKYDVAIRIEDGSIKYQSLILRAIGSGSVTTKGRLVAKIGEAKVNGKLAQSTGAGIWHSPKCTGTWTASRADI